tara:strand:+ start:2101 stop:2781 length:681 start_codon:yes stop_codon:yes gene_type:complete
MKFNLFILFIAIFSVNAVELPFYEAKYKFESDEINITGIRKFNKNSKGYEIEFQASNLFVGMNFSSFFHFEEYKIIPKSYDVKIKPKFLNRDQFIEFDYEENQIISKGSNEWFKILNQDVLIMDPLNVQIMIRTLIKENKKEFTLNILDMQTGDYKEYDFEVIGSEMCFFNEEKTNCIVLQRSREGSDRKVTYFLMEKYEYMFLKIIDINPERKNTLNLEEILSFG